MAARLTEAQAREMGLPVPKRRHKYGARRTEVDGIKFASAKEARRYSELKAMEASGLIHGLELQPGFDLHAPHWKGGLAKVWRYVADFSYFDADGKATIEDVKGFRTAVYKAKKEHLYIEYGIQVVEV